MRLILIISFFCLMMSALHLNANPLYHVDNIAETVSVKNTNAAKKIALNRAEKKALKNLFYKLTLECDHRRIDEILDEASDLHFIASYEISDEKVRTGFYEALFSFTFSPSAIQKFLSTQNIPYTDQIAPPLLIIASLIEDQENNRLWQDNKDWDRSWKNLDKTASLPLRIQIARGDLEDIALLSFNDLYQGKKEAFRNFLAHYKVNQFILINLMIEGNPTLSGIRWRTLRTYYDHNGEGDTEISEGHLSALNEESYARIRNQILKEMIEEWKRKTLIEDNSQQTQDFLFNLKVGLKDLIHIKKTLTQLSFVKNYQINYLDQNEVNLTISYLGTIDNLKRSLKNNHLFLKATTRSYE